MISGSSTRSLAPAKVVRDPATPPSPRQYEGPRRQRLERIAHVFFARPRCASATDLTMNAAGMEERPEGAAASSRRPRGSGSPAERRAGGPHAPSSGRRRRAGGSVRIQAFPIEGRRALLASDGISLSRVAQLAPRLGLETEPLRSLRDDMPHDVHPTPAGRSSARGDHGNRPWLLSQVHVRIRRRAKDHGQGRDRSSWRRRSGSTGPSAHTAPATDHR